jgi:hypothetical protein
MGRGLGAFQREVLQRIGRHIATFGEARVGEVARDMAMARGLTLEVEDDLGSRHRLDVAHQLGLRRALATLDQRGLLTRYVGGLVELTEAGAAIAGDCQPMTPAEIGDEARAAMNAIQRRREAAIAMGRLKPNGERWD